METIFLQGGFNTIKALMYLSLTSQYCFKLQQLINYLELKGCIFVIIRSLIEQYCLCFIPRSHFLTKPLSYKILVSKYWPGLKA